MIITPIKTRRVTAGSLSLIQLIDESITDLRDNSIVVITSKVVSLCENAVVPINSIDRETLIAREADLYLPSTLSSYGHHFAIKNNTLIASAGIDTSNTGDYYVLWPKNPQKTANTICAYLRKKFNLTHVGIIITDSTCQPLRRGTTGIALAHSGFSALHNYVGMPDLFGHPFKVTHANVSGGLAAAAVVTMGEGAESMPLCLIMDIPFIKFLSYNPTSDELAEQRISLEDDLFAPFINTNEWKKGGK